MLDTLWAKQKRSMEKKKKRKNKEGQGSKKGEKVVGTLRFRQ